MGLVAVPVLAPLLTMTVVGTYPNFVAPLIISTVLQGGRNRDGHRRPCRPKTHFIFRARDTAQLAAPGALALGRERFRRQSLASLFTDSHPRKITNPARLDVMGEVTEIEGDKGLGRAIAKHVGELHHVTPGFSPSPVPSVAA